MITPDGWEQKEGGWGYQNPVAQRKSLAQLVMVPLRGTTKLVLILGWELENGTRCSARLLPPAFQPSSNAWYWQNLRGSQLAKQNVIGVIPALASQNRERVVSRLRRQLDEPSQVLSSHCLCWITFTKTYTQHFAMRISIFVKNGPIKLTG